jgi:tetratricopeptide (TPR) repeat protein
MPRPITKNRKRRDGIQIQPVGFSKSLWDARNLIALGQNDQGLATLNRLATATTNPKRRAKILMLVGESEAKLSRHNDAAVAYARASDHARLAADLDLLLRSGSGQIRSLLRSLRTDEARTVAAGLLAELQKAQEDYQKILDLTPQQLAASGVVQVPAQPPRPTVVFTKIAVVFVESGLTEDARTFLLKALQLSPNGAARARQILASLALAADDPSLAERYARESLLMGRFQAKTVAAWQLYLDARARQARLPILEADVFASFQANARGRIASASVLSIVRVLRAHGDPAWSTIARSAVESSDMDAIIGTELEKLMQADAKLTGSAESRVIAARALRLFRAGKVSPQEQVAHAKCYVHYSLVADELRAFDSIVTLATNRFGKNHADSVIHSMALGAMQAGKHEVARKWLMKLLASVEPGTESWGKAMWALARMEALLKRYSEAALIHLQIATSIQTPPRFRMQSMLLGFKNLAASGDTVNLDEISVSMKQLLGEITDYRVALDAARQLSLAGNLLRALNEEATAKAAILVDQALATTTPAAERLAILEYTARKQFWDLGHFAAVVDRWGGLTELQMAEMRVTGGSAWYEYCSLVMRSMAKLGQDQKARALAASILDGRTATPEGYVIMGNAYAEWLLALGEKEKAFTYFDWISVEAPTHLGAAAAHYWLALRHLNSGRTEAALSAARAVRRCFGTAPSLLSEWELDAKALLILTDFSPETAIQQGRSTFNPEFICQMLDRLLSDRESIR